MARSMTICSAAALALALAATASAATTPADDPRFAACNARATTTLAMLACDTSEAERVDARLASAFAATLAALPPDRRAKLRASERRWEAFRRSDCAVYVGADTGTLAPVEGGRCLIDRAKRRIVDLAGFVAR